MTVVEHRKYILQKEGKMKKLIGITLLAMSALSFHAYAELSYLPDDAAKMLENADEYAACMSRLDQSYLEQLFTKKVEPNEREVRRLCGAGQRDEAQAKSKSLAQELRADPEFKKSMECNALLGMDDFDDEDIHVCDDL